MMRPEGAESFALGLTAEVPEIGRLEKNLEGSVSFSGLVDAIRALESRQQVAESEAVRVAEGRPGNMHDAVLAMREAEISLELALSLRDKLVQAYEELMRTRV